jgi:adenylosuccinate synthase
MSVTVVVGGQYGSEGKGKLVSYLARAATPTAVVRGGGANAGHTAEGPLGRFMLRALPSGAVHPHCQLLLSAGMQLDLDVLLTETADLEVSPSRLMVDGGATLIGPEDVELERESGLGERIGSTLTGTGAAGARKVLRARGLRRAADEPRLAPFIGDVAGRLAELRAAGTEIVVEGSQGAGLSLHHGPWPYATSRDTTAASFLAEAGLPVTAVSDVVVVLRTYPIRVAGSSGPLAGELSWDDVRRRAGYPTVLAEYTTVTGRLRRVGEFDWDLATRAVQLNGPTALALHGVDYLNYADLGVKSYEELSTRTREFIGQLEHRLQVPVRYVFTGPDGGQLIDRHPETVRERQGSTERAAVRTAF